MNEPFVIIMTILSVISLAILLVVLGDDDITWSEFWGISFVICVIQLFGWGLVGNVFPFSSNKEILIPEKTAICRTDKTLVVEIDGKQLIDNTHEMYAASNECFRVIKYTSYNAYGGVYNTTHILTLEKNIK
jgi:hypothetical protein